MQAAAIHYFSGTGNTYRAMRIIEGKLRGAGYIVDVYRVSELTEPPAKRYMLHVFAYPVYALDMPHVMLRYMRKLPRDSARAAVIAIFGELGPGVQPGGYEGNAVARARKLLRKKGYDVFLTDATGYPHSITIGLNPPKQEDQQAIRALSDKEIEEIADYIVRLGSSIRPESLLNPLYGLCGAMYRTFGRRAIGRLYVADAACNGCGKCVRCCPAGAIALVDGRPRWSLGCEGCQRCINACPHRAIQTSAVRLAGTLALSVFAPVSLIGVFMVPYDHFFMNSEFGPIVVDGWSSGLFIGLLAWIIITCLLYFYALDAVILAGERNRKLWPFFHATFTRGYRRYLDPGFNPIEPLPQAPGPKG